MQRLLHDLRIHSMALQQHQINLIIETEIRLQNFTNGKSRWSSPRKLSNWSIRQRLQSLIHLSTLLIIRRSLRAEKIPIKMQEHLSIRFQPLHGFPRSHSKEKRLHIWSLIPNNRHPLLRKQANSQANRPQNAFISLPFLRVQNNPE